MKRGNSRQFDPPIFPRLTASVQFHIKQLHDRMPCIIPEKGYDRWIQPGAPDRPPIDLLRPFDAEKMTAWKVDKAVGNVKNDSPDLIEPFNEPEHH
jgi:putative SOS response-associated peptidase YedK